MSLGSGINPLLWAQSVPQGGVSGKLLVSYVLLEDLGEGLGKVSNDFKVSADRSGAVTGSTDVDQVINSFGDDTSVIRDHLSKTLLATGQSTHQAAVDYKTIDQALL